MENIIRSARFKALMAKVDEQPKEVQAIFYYLIAELLVKEGSLVREGSFKVEHKDFVLYRDKATGQMIEAEKPEIDEATEEIFKAEINAFLEGRDYGRLVH